MATASAAHPRRASYVLAGMAALLLWGFGFVADEVLEGDTVAFDQAVTSAFREPGSLDDPWGPTWLEEAMRDVTALGSFTILGFILLVTVLFLALSGKGRTAVFVAVSVIGGTIASTGLKMLFDRPRPDVEAATRVFTASFPSGHATVSAVVFLTLGLLLAEAMTDRRLKIYFIVLGVFVTLCVGISRIYIGVHYPTDVLAGWSLGAAWALICWAGYSLLFGHDRGKTDT
ncbi:phosphatase PAP2 family protein [Devosia sp. CN2-171]|jgi:undecaprenyl-diphosphatase|uniref:phosphatase PAP2 family protein n=1 Tax=Devosia sp. CN2-171 TaxID=3400909 RepID=UPI003BF7F24E